MTLLHHFLLILISIDVVFLSLLLITPTDAPLHLTVLRWSKVYDLHQALALVLVLLIFVLVLHF